MAGGGRRVNEPARPEKSLEREIRAFHWIRLLAELSGRFAGTDQEGEAARRVESWLRELGFEEIEFTSVPSRPRAGWVWAAHFLLAAIGCAVGGSRAWCSRARRRCRSGARQRAALPGSRVCSRRATRRTSSRASGRCGRAGASC